MTGEDQLRIGGRHVDRATARRDARTYLTARDGYAYPSYDGFDAEHAMEPLVDADFLAPLLLNVNYLKITTYEALTTVRSRLQPLLHRIDPTWTLARAEPVQLEMLAELYEVIDGGAVSGVEGTVLSKILHRKRPAFIPLYDRQVGHVYQDGPEAPVPRVKGRSWSQFMLAFAGAVQADLLREPGLWEEIARFAEKPSITPLRALDIVAWQAGRNDDTAARQMDLMADEDEEA
ncbi:hypothetical protein ABIB25_005914 [Nakamurella sp. UYEF19]|uniref:DUF6308 family protein n=1 Tax=Nakamurella sp. UYEF19 TaxID=1756392 RepID=UPI003396371A